MSFNISLNPNVVKTAIDEVFEQEYDFRDLRTATVEDGMLFKQIPVDRNAYIMETFQGPGLWQQTNELEGLHEDTMRTGNQNTYTIKKWTNSTPISLELFEDDQHAIVGEMIRRMAMKARVTRDNYGFSLWRDAFDGNTFTTGGSTALISDSHTTLSGDTVDNKETAALSPDTLETMIVSLREQLDQSGDIVGHEPGCLLVPSALYKDACEILDSELEAATADNQVNVYSTKYGISLKMTPYLGTAAGGGDAYAFLLARNHSVCRFVRKNVETELVPPEYSTNDAYVYKGRFREEVGVQSYEGVVGTDGTT